MGTLRDSWMALDSRGRRAMLAGTIACMALVLVLGAWLLRTEEAVLFADLKPQDTAALVAELDRLRIPYRIAGDGNTLLVDASVVHATRLRLMGRSMPLAGPAGFELFNNADIGMTEFAQKVNWQRALQGELARTILSLAEVRDARVHLALPEEGLFKRSNARGKASITLHLKPGESLRPEQVAGIQRLVASAVAGMAVQDVTIVDQRGVALTRAAGAEGEAEAAGRLDMKRDLEQLLARKASAVLEQAFGAGAALVSVDATLAMDQVRVTTEEVVGAPGAGGSGVMVREREVLREGAGRQGEAAAPGSSQRDVDYQVGRRIEQVASPPGTLRRLQVVAVVKQALDEAALRRTRDLVAAAVGAMPERGDTVVVQAIALPVAEMAPAVAAATAPAAASPAALLPSVADASAARAAGLPLAMPWVLGALAALLILACILLAAVLVKRRQPSPARLTEVQRQLLLAQVQGWLGTPLADPAAKPPEGAKRASLGEVFQ